ncbi:Hypothetical predicted protein [Paramuricea clavata]|uniref:Uncharacterized protein n=1 Tax=Paramuricea clavata TaxID=317549 RepID=A0A6S7HKS2_PARCT|nr:Hypothetical predicted protein [Paramuricea clavata]
MFKPSKKKLIMGAVPTLFDIPNPPPRIGTKRRLLVRKEPLENKTSKKKRRVNQQELSNQRNAQVACDDNINQTPLYAENEMIDSMDLEPDHEKEPISSNHVNTKRQEKSHASQDRNRPCTETNKSDDASFNKGEKCQYAWVS